jgi:hypothetical protein
MVITYIANVLFIIIILFAIWFIVGSIIYGHKPVGGDSQSERQKRNDDYNNDYYP